MSATVIEWIAVLIFFLFFWGFNALEAMWLSKRGWAAFSRSLTFSISSNLLGLFIGSAVVFVILMVLLMLTFEPASSRTLTESIMLIGVILAFIFPPLFLFLVKRLLLKLFKMDAGRPAWAFSLLSSVLVVFTSVAVPSAFLYIVLKIAG